MGEARRRKRQLGELYGTPEASLANRLARIKNQAGVFYLDLDPATAFEVRFAAADNYLQKYPAEVIEDMHSLPADFFASFHCLLGHVLVGARQWEFWDEISRHLVKITTGSENTDALIAWNTGAGDCWSDPRIWCFNILQKLPDMPLGWRNNAIKAEICRHGIGSGKIWYVEGIPNHMTVSGSLAAGCALHQAGSLYLFDPGHVRGGNHELWLARLRPDGIYATSQLAKTGDLKPSEIKSMKNFIAGYKGPRISGQLENAQGLDAQRICKAVGMTVAGNRAWIGS